MTQRKHTPGPWTVEDLMGEQRRRQGKYADLQRITKMLTDEGRLVEAGWTSLRLMSVPDDASPVQLDEMRNAFFAGAQHLFYSIMTILDPGEDPTHADMSRMDSLDRELRGFMEEFKLRHSIHEGHS